jgi:hypothetical protein
VVALALAARASDAPRTLADGAAAALAPAPGEAFGVLSLAQPIMFDGDIDVWSLTPDELDEFCRLHGGVYMALSIYNGAFVNVCAALQVFGPGQALFNEINGMFFFPGDAFLQCNNSCVHDGWFNRITGGSNHVTGWGNVLVESFANVVVGDFNYLESTTGNIAIVGDHNTVIETFANAVEGNGNVIAGGNMNTVVGDNNSLTDQIGQNVVGDGVVLP